MINVGIVGGAGYTAGELIRLLLHHPEVNLKFVYSSSQAGKKIHEVHADLVGSTTLIFSSEIQTDVDVLFLCLGHGKSKAFLENNPLAVQTKIIDLSTDFRSKQEAFFEEKSFVYGLPELNKAQIESAEAIANPGCFATAIQLALLPLAKSNELKHAVHVHAVTGATGAGTSLSSTGHFAWRDNNFSYYKPFTHQHLGEIKESLSQLGQEPEQLYFLPYRGNFSRGIFATVYTQFEGSLDRAQELFSDFYREARFTHGSTQALHLKQVVNTNNCLIHLYKHEDQLLVTSIIDNLLKGASGQAMQNMNLMFGLEESTGLLLKGSYF